MSASVSTPTPESDGADGLDGAAVGVGVATPSADGTSSDEASADVDDGSGDLTTPPSGAAAAAAAAPRGVERDELAAAGKVEGVRSPDDDGSLLSRQKSERLAALTALVIGTAGEVLKVSSVSKS